MRWALLLGVGALGAWWVYRHPGVWGRGSQEVPHIAATHYVVENGVMRTI
jgi:hypothetical protein